MLGFVLAFVLFFWCCFMSSFGVGSWPFFWSWFVVIFMLVYGNFLVLVFEGIIMDGLL